MKNSLMNKKYCTIIILFNILMFKCQAIIPEQIVAFWNGGGGRGRDSVQYFVSDFPISVQIHVWK